jgi:ribose 5-phosphate isomerase RpiB
VRNAGALQNLTPRPPRTLVPHAGIPGPHGDAGAAPGEATRGVQPRAADIVVTGCGKGMGAMLACNSMPGVFCGFVIDSTDAFLFGQINDGTCLAMPYAKGFGWAAELNLQDCYRKLFEVGRGVGYPKERAAIMARNRSVLKGMKAAACRDMLSVLQAVDAELLKATITGEKFWSLFLPYCQHEAMASYLQGVING